MKILAKLFQWKSYNFAAEIGTLFYIANDNNWKSLVIKTFHIILPISSSVQYLPFPPHVNGTCWFFIMF